MLSEFLVVWGAVSLLLVVVLVILMIRLACTECDLTLQWAEKFGHSTVCLSGKVAWITGASSGIGEALAYELASDGCRLVISARRKEELERVKKNILDSSKLKSEDVLIVPLDLLQYNTHQQAVETALKYFKKVDILVNNAGRSQRALWLKTSLEVDRKMMELNVLGTLSLTKSLLPHMVKQKSGHIVVVSSLAGKLGAPGLGSYSGSKHALHGYFESLRIEGHEHNIHITMVCPGPVFSNALVHAFTEDSDKSLGIEMDSRERRITSERCARLMAVAMANKLDEIWVAMQPELLFIYAVQYLPTITRKLSPILGKDRLRKLQAGVKSLHGIKN